MFFCICYFFWFSNIKDCEAFVVVVFFLLLLLLLLLLWLLVVAGWLLVGCWLLVVGCWLLVVGCWLLVVVVVVVVVVVACCCLLLSSNSFTQQNVYSKQDVFQYLDDHMKMDRNLVRPSDFIAANHYGTSPCTTLLRWERGHGGLKSAW